MKDHMHPRTASTLSQLEYAKWFSAVGQPLDGPFVTVSSWDEAIAHCGSTTWEDLQLEASNRFAEIIARKALGRFEKWNDIANEMKEVTTPLVKSKIASVVATHNLFQVFEDAVQWDILALCMESEYADIQAPGFFASQAYWYATGRFPCGWIGPFPEGKLVLY